MKNLIKVLAVMGIIVGALVTVKLLLELFGSGIKSYVKIDRGADI